MLAHEPQLAENETLATIFRILGNENPPRDTIGKRLEVLERILKTEPKFENIQKWYLVNRICNIQFRRQICELLDRYNAKYITIPLDIQHVLNGSDRNEKILRAININSARNFAINFSRWLSVYTIVLDGDCMFDMDGWKPIEAEMKKEQYDYLSIPHKRANGDLAEPMVAFKNTATLRFNESIPFGEGDKLQLLFDLGHDRTAGSGHCNVIGDKTKTVGFVHHLSTGPDEYESDTISRIEARNKSLDILLSKIKSFNPIRFSGHNVKYENVEGFFDYSGQYSGIALDCPDNAKIVEVGSWLGKSAIYLAAELSGYGKRATIDCVDTWDGGLDESLKRRISELGNIYELFLQNVDDAGFSHMIKAVKKPSIVAAEDYRDNTIDAIWIDADHSYHEIKADIAAWYPKVKIGGLIAGHDFAMDHEFSRNGVVRAVLEFFKDKPLEIQPMGRTWKSVKYDNNWPEFRERRWV